jgi:hypothetical protein
VLIFTWAPNHEGVLREWRYSSTHSLTSALDGGEWSASRPGRFTSRERTPGTHWIGCWLGPRAVLGAVVKREIPSPRRESKPRTPINITTAVGQASLTILVWSWLNVTSHLWLHFCAWRLPVTQQDWVCKIIYSNIALDDQVFESREGLGIFLLITASRKAVGPTQPPIQWVSGALYVGLKRLGRKADNSLASSADVTNTSTYTSTPPIHTPSRRGAQIKQVSVIRLGIPVPLYCDVI